MPDSATTRHRPDTGNANDTGPDTADVRPGWPLIGRSLLASRAHLLRLAGWSALEALPAMLSGVLVARALDDGFIAGDPVRGVAWLSLLLVAHGVGAVATRLTFPAVGAVVESLRDDLMSAVVRGAVRGRPREYAPDSGLVARIGKQIDSVRRSGATLLNSVRRFVFTMTAAVVGLGVLAPEVLWLVVPPILASVVLFVLLLRTLARRQDAALAAGEVLAREAGDALSGRRDVAAFRRQDAVVDRVHATMADERAADQRVARGTAWRGLVTALGAFVPMVAVLAAAPSLLESGLTAGVLVGTVTYLSTNVEPTVRMLTDVVGGPGLHLFVTVRRLAENHPEPPPAPPRRGPEPAGYRVRTERLCFAYGAAATPVIRDLDLDVPEGEHLVVVGPSGTGKSTLSALVAGTLSPDTGRVLLGGRSVHDLAPDQRAWAVTLVPQESYVFGAALRDNLAYLCPGATDTALSAAAERVGAGPLVARLGGLDAEVDPSELSSGEKQLLSLARAYASPAPVVVLDEATCHLDPGAEARAENAFRARPGTLVVIAHRLSSAMRADRILLLDGGRRFLGTHDELLLTSPIYREMVGEWTA